MRLKPVYRAVFVLTNTGIIMSESFLLFCGFLAVVIAAGFYVAHLDKGK